MQQKTLSSFLLTLTALTCISAPALADQVYLRNGDRISGTLLDSEPSGMINFETSYGSRIQFALSDILAVKPEGEAAASARDYAALPTDNTSTPTQEPATPAASPDELETADTTEEAPADPSKYKWKGNVNFGASLDDGNTQQKNITADAELSARNEKNRYIAGAEANYTKDEGMETENDQSLLGEYNRFISEKWFVGGREELKRDKIALLDLRSQTGLFVGRQFFERDDLNMKARLGSDYIYEDYTTGDTEENIAAAWAFDYDQTFFEEAFTLFHGHDIDVPVGEADAFLVETESGVQVPVGTFLTGTAEVDFDWDNAPAEGVREEDVTYSLKLGYEW